MMRPITNDNSPYSWHQNRLTAPTERPQANNLVRRPRNFGRARTPTPLKQSPNGATEKPGGACAISVAPLGLWNIQYVFRALPGPAIIAPDLRSFKASQASGMWVRRPLKYVYKSQG